MLVVRGFSVLISTYWNVNLNDTIEYDVSECFNLNLLECKFFSDFDTSEITAF